VNNRSTVYDLLDRADVVRAASRGDVAARLYAESITRCRTEGDLPGWTRAALGAASVYVFGAEPGRLPAELYDVLVRTTDEGDRARIAAALARCWVYAGHPARAARFADEAVERAICTGQPELISDALDAALAARWGPDDLAARVELARRLDDVAAHVLDPAARLQARLWGLQVACEALDLPSVHRHMRALELLAEESPRAEFFAASRRLMLDLLRGRTDTAAQLIDLASHAAEKAELPDAWMVLGSMRGYAAVQAGGHQVCEAIAAEMETFGLAEGAAAVCAEAAFMWLYADRPDRSRELVKAFSGSALVELPPDVNWLLTLQCVLEAALAVNERDVAAEAARLLTPYAGRAVFNAGAVMFHGLTDDTLSRAAALSGDAETAGRLRKRALATYERLGASWWRDRLAGGSAPDAEGDPVQLRPTADGLWLIGPLDSPLRMRALRGHAYLRELLRRPGASIPALDLVAARTGATVMQPSLGDVLDEQAIRAYRRRLQEIERDLAAAEDRDTGRLDPLHAERDALIAELAAASGLAGRTRPTGASSERARVAVTKAINAAVERIAAHDPALGAHLRRSVRTGAQCSYHPLAQDTRAWLLD
jgi:hypothetical protein